MFIPHVVRRLVRRLVKELIRGCERMRGLDLLEYTGGASVKLYLASYDYNYVVKGPMLILKYLILSFD